MKSVVEKRLFWFLKEGTELDLSNKTHLDIYVQHTLSRGRTADIKMLFKMLKPSDFAESFLRIKNFLPHQIKRFWEEWIGNIIKSTEKDTRPF